MTSAPKNIVVLSDGTGNAAAKVWRTNVWRLFQSQDLTNPRQVAIYDDGVGSSAFKPLALLEVVAVRFEELHTHLCPRRV
jgi:uncharacterized protein (DUF2235 family)